MSTSNPLNRELIEAEPWIGDQRAQVLALLEERAAAMAGMEMAAVACVSRDLVERAFQAIDELVTDDYDLGVGKSGVRLAHLLLREALGR